MVRGQEWTFPAVKGHSHRCTDVLEYLRSECQLQVLRSSSVRLALDLGRGGGFGKGDLGGGLIWEAWGAFRGFGGLYGAYMGCFGGL